MIKYASQYITREDIKSVSSALKRDLVTQGNLNSQFEANINKLVHSKYCLTTNSASSALLLACKAVGLKKGDYGWTTTNTFAATSNSIMLCGANLDFVEINEKTFNICENKLEKKLKKTKKNKLPKVLIVVHYGGNPCELKKIYKLSKKYKFKIIEDASHAIGSKYYKNPIGNCKYSDITIFSFHAIKIITTCEGGAITTNNSSYYQTIKMMRTNGIVRKNFKNNNNKFEWFYEQRSLGYNFRLNEIQAALGLSQLKKINIWIKKRNDIAKFYKKSLNYLPLSFQDINKNSVSSYHLFTVVIQKKNLRNKLINYLKKKKILANVVYIPLYRHPIHKKNFIFNKFQNSENYYKNCISIPMHINLSKKNLALVVKLIKKFFEEN